MNQAIVNGYNDASRLITENKLDAALVLCQSLLKLAPANSAVLNLAGSALYRKRMLPEAENLLSIALEMTPEAEEITLNLARVLRGQKRPRRAAAVLEQGLAHCPDSPRLLSALGETLYYDRQFPNAARVFERLLGQDRDNVDILFRLACAYQECDRTEAAFDAYHEILDRQSDHPDAHVNLAQIYKSLGNHDKAIALFSRSSQLVPNDPAYASRALFCMNYGFTEGSRFLRQAVEWAERHADPHFPAVTPSFVGRDWKPVRLGFVSADFINHPVGKLFLPVLERLDPALFDVHCFANVQIEDDMTRRYQAICPNYHDIRDMDDDAVRDFIRRCGIDVLVDLSGHSNHNRLGVFARKPAPVQIMWLGYFNTTGMKAMDYVLADPVNIPEDQEQHYRERVLRLADSFFPYVPSAPPARRQRRNNAPISFGCFNDSGKINDAVLKMWAAILGAVPDSRLFLKSKTFSDQWVRNLFLDRAMSQGIDPHRIIFLGPSNYAEYLRDYAKVDIALDPFPYSGGATTADALSMGTPVLTCPFDSFGSRLSASVLHACGMGELVCADLDEYATRAVALATDAELLATTTDRLVRTFPASRLCDVDRFTRNFEQVILGTLS